MLTDVPDPTQMDAVMKYDGGLSCFERRYYAGRYFALVSPSCLCWSVDIGWLITCYRTILP